MLGILMPSSSHMDSEEKGRFKEIEQIYMEKCADVLSENINFKEIF